VGSLGDAESDHWQAHPDEDEFAILNLSRGRGHHQFASGEPAGSGV
jgi:hypothetical protein